MLSPDVQVMLHPGPKRPSVKLTDAESGTSVEVKGLPRDSVVIKADLFKGPFPIFNENIGDIRKRADFVIVSNDEHDRKWIVCIETKGGNKPRGRIVAQLRGASCFISYCRCIGKVFWESEEFLDGYEQRFVSIARLNDTKKQGTYSSNANRELHNQPELFLKISRITTLHFSKLINLVP